MSYDLEEMDNSTVEFNQEKIAKDLSEPKFLITSTGDTVTVDDIFASFANQNKVEEMEVFFKGFSKLDKEGQEQIIEIKEDFDNIVDNSGRVCREASADRDKYKKQSERYLVLCFVVVAISLFTLLK